MQVQQLGQSDLVITRIGFGAWAIGGGEWAFGWGAQDDRLSIQAIHAALDYGINWIDTAAIYGLGHSETIVGQALKGRSQRPYVFTKCGMLWDSAGDIHHKLQADSIRAEVEASLRRLQTDVIDLYQIHWPLPDHEIEEGWSTLAELQREGKIRYIGASNFSVEQMQRAQLIAPITSLQPPYSLINRDIEPSILPFCQKHSIGVIVYSPMQSGLLSGSMTKERVAAFPPNDWRRHETDFQEPQLSRNLMFTEHLKKIGERYNRSAGEVAIAWTLSHPVVTGAIVGFRSPQQVAGLVDVVDFTLTAEDIAAIQSALSTLADTQTMVIG